MIVTPKILSEEEKQLRAWKNDKEVQIVLKCSASACKKCNKIFEIVIKTKEIICKCHKYIIKNYLPVQKNCEVLYERKSK